MSETDNRDANNLLLLCLRHAWEIDEVPEQYPVQLLRTWKHDQLAEYESARRGWQISDDEVDEAVAPIGLDAAIEERSAFGARSRVQLHDFAATRVGRSPVARSAYLQQVRRIAPPELVGRDVELDELAAFCSQAEGGPYRWWRGEAWAGKSALMSWFVLHPPAGVRLVSFFITARLSGQGDRVAFADVVLEELADLLNVPAPPFLTEATREAHLLEMLDAAAYTCQRGGQRLVLVVDGLDEDLGWKVSADAHSIAALLPADPPAGMRIIVAGRPNPPLPADVPAGHPLRDPAVVRWLGPSPQAMVVKHDAQRELRRLLDGTSTERQLLGLVAVAGGGLSAPDLAELTGCSPQEIDDRLQAVSGRTFRTRGSRWRPDTNVYLLAHEELQQTTIRYLRPDELKQYQQQLHDWADRYRARRWPPETPEYLLRSYPQLLRSSNDVSRMAELAVDADRHDWMLAVTGGDSAALVEVLTAQEAVLTQHSADLATMARLAAHREALRQRNSNVPGQLAAVWARLGQFPRAEALAQAIDDRDEQSRALCSVARIAAEAGNVERAEQLASSVAVPDEQITALLAIATTAPTNGDLDHAISLVARAQAIADVLPQAWWQARTWARIARAAARLGDGVAYTELADRAEHLARSLTQPFPQQQELARVAEEAAHAGDLDRAERIAKSLVDPHARALLFGELARASGNGPNVNRLRALLDRAQNEAASLSDPAARARTLSVTARAAAEAGESERAYHLAGQAAASARTLTEPDQQALVLSWTAETLAATGTSDEACALIDEAETIAMSIVEDNSRSSTLSAVASAAFSAVGMSRARRIVEYLDSPDARVNALSAMGYTATLKGDLQDAEELARSIDKPYERVHLLTAVAEAMISAGQTEQAAELATEIETTARSIVNAESQAEAWAALTTAMISSNDLIRAATFAARTATWAHMIAFPATRTDLLETAADALIRSGDPEAASRLATAVADIHVRAEVASTIAQAMIRSGYPDLAEALLRLLPSPLPKVRALTRAAIEATNGTQLHLAQAFIGQAESAALTIDDPNMVESARSYLAEAMAHTGNVDGAQTLAQSIQDTRTRTHTLVAIADAIVGTEAAIAILDQAATTVDLIKKPNASVQALAKIASTTLLAGAADRLGPLVDRGEAIARSEDEQIQPQLLAVVATIAAKAGDVDRADKLARTGEATWQSHARTLAEVAEAMIAAGAPDRAEGLASSIRTSWQPHVQAKLAKAMARAGDTTRAERLASLITNTDLQAEALAALAATADQTRSRHLFMQALHLGRWQTVAPALACHQPDITRILADEVTTLAQRNLLQPPLVDVTPTMKLSLDR